LIEKQLVRHYGVLDISSHTNNIPNVFTFPYSVGMEQDYFSGPYFITYPAGSTKSVFSIAIINDNVLEKMETFDVIINSSSLPSNVTNGELGDTAVIIWDNDGESESRNGFMGIYIIRVFVPYHDAAFPWCLNSDFFSTAIKVNLSQAQYSFAEDRGKVQIELLFSNPSSFDIAVHVMFNDITGLNISECVESDGTGDYPYGVFSVTFSADTVIQFLNITISDDDVLEEDETFSLTIVSNSNPDNVTNSSPENASVTIVDNDCK